MISRVINNDRPSFVDVSKPSAMYRVRMMMMMMIRKKLCSPALTARNSHDRASDTL